MVSIRPGPCNAVAQCKTSIANCCAKRIRGHIIYIRRTPDEKLYSFTKYAYEQSNRSGMPPMELYTPK